MASRALTEMAQDFLALPRIAVAGVSTDSARHPVGAAIYRRLKRGATQVFAVNPHLEQFEGETCYPDLKSIPGGVDGVVIVTRPSVTEALVRQACEAGVRQIWMHGSAAQTSSVSAEAVQFARDRGVTVIAGACPMMFGEGVDFGHACMRWMLKSSAGLIA